MPLERIVVFGTTGSGKSTLARRLSERLGLPYFETDALHWNPGWIPTPELEFRARVEKATEGPRWVTEGNYSAIRDILLSRADTAIWLDYPFPLVFSRLLKRTLRRVIHREAICNGNYETWQQTFSRDSILLWAFKSHWRKKRQYPDLWRRYPHLTVLRFASSSQTEAWLGELRARVVASR